VPRLEGCRRTESIYLSSPPRFDRGGEMDIRVEERAVAAFSPRVVTIAFSTVRTSRPAADFRREALRG
jgi:hypothetical protein